MDLRFAQRDYPPHVFFEFVRARTTSAARWTQDQNGFCAHGERSRHDRIRRGDLRRQRKCGKNDVHRVREIIVGFANRTHGPRRSDVRDGRHAVHDWVG
jgi:hypothetical protein